ncbi:MAG: DNA-formamidopyrimidine glycosylase [Caldiserica bacterium]|jgi:formamidopyrimidine-DNA glycosylase|nr:DNA-formamidopyrimidine glycosylase [Caldisericota bacterium]MDH7562287.1 DNA-formamidopyrimidine glycosylase [Caldisericota bacterium]
MPELPDLEVIKENLRKKILGFEVKGVHFLKKSSGKPSPEVIQEGLIGEKLVLVDRRGKFLKFGFKKGSLLLAHLMLEGQLEIKSSGEAPEKGTCAVIDFKEGNGLHFIDPRGWTKLFFYPAGKSGEPEELANLGPEPLSPEFTPEYFREGLRKLRGTLKMALMEQEFISGIGNAYSDEILFKAKISPLKPAKDLTEREKDLLFKCIKETLLWGIEETKTRMGEEVRGEIREFLQVHRKEGQACPRCGTKIQRIEVEGRGTYFCPRCQR